MESSLLVLPDHRTAALRALVVIQVLEHCDITAGRFLANIGVRLGRHITLLLQNLDPLLEYCYGHCV